MERIDDLLKTKWLGRVYQYREETVSTNDLCYELAEKGEPMGLVVSSESQTGGRGRNGRSWVSPSGGLWFSLLLRPSLSPQAALALNPVTAVGLCRGLMYYPGLGAQIKWPNDIFVGGKKLGGILGEMKVDKDKLNYIVIGIGINLSLCELPEELQNSAEGMEDYLGIGVDRRELLCRLLLGLESAYEQFFNGQKEALFAEWQEQSFLAEKKITVDTGKGKLKGTPIGLTDDGFLLLDLGGGKGAKIISGDITWEDASPSPIGGK